MHLPTNFRRGSHVLSIWILKNSPKIDRIKTLQKRLSLMILLTDFSVTSLLNSYLTRVHSLVCLVEGFMFIFFLLCRIIIQQIELVQLFFFLQNLMWFNMSKIYKNKFDVWYVADTKTGSILSQIYINWTVMIHDINDICLTICDHTIYGVPPMFVRTRSHSFACLLLWNTEQYRQQFTIY